MSRENPDNEEQIRRFLLGEMSEEERTAFEEKFVADEGLFEQIRVVEDELIEAYARGGGGGRSMPAAEREKFERNFLSTERRRERLAFSRALLDELSERRKTVPQIETPTAAARQPSVRDSVAAFFQTPKFAFSAALALLLLIFGGWFLTRNAPPGGPEIAGKITPTPDAVTPPQISENVAGENANATGRESNAAVKADPNKNPQNRNAADSEREKPVSPISPISPTRGAVASLVLFPGATRGEGKISELKLPKNALSANLQLNFQTAGDYQTYRAEIVDAESGGGVFRGGRLRARNSKINFLVPAAKLQNGDYIVRLYGQSAGKPEESVEDYTFRVSRK